MMADFYQFLVIFHGLHQYILGQLIIIRRWVGRAWEWGGWWQRLKQRSKITQMVEFRVAVMSTCYPQGHYSTTRPRQMCTDSESSIRSSLPNWSPHWCHFTSHRFMCLGKNRSGEADQLTLASRGSEYAYLFGV